MAKRTRTTKPKPAPVTGEQPAATVAAPVAPTRIGGFTLGNIARTAGVVVAQRTHYGTTSSRDEAYLALFATTAADAEKCPDGTTITLAALASHGTNKFYTGSAKPHDAGAINRAIKAGNATKSDDGKSISLTDKGAELARNVLKKLAQPTEAPAE